MKQNFGKGLIILCYILGWLIGLVWLGTVFMKSYAGFVEDGIWGAFMSFTFWVFVGGLGAFLITVIIIVPIFLLGKYLLETDSKNAPITP